MTVSIFIFKHTQQNGMSVGGAKQRTDEVVLSQISGTQRVLLTMCFFRMLCVCFFLD